MAVTIMLIATIWLLSLLPFLLLVALVISITLIPVIRRLRQDIKEAGFIVDEACRTDQLCGVNITPWHRQIRNVWREFNFGKVR